jgi:hypothetical protein
MLIDARAAMEKEVHWLISREAALRAIAGSLGVSAECAAEIAAEVPWSLSDLRVLCAAGWTPEGGMSTYRVEVVAKVDALGQASEITPADIRELGERFARALKRRGKSSFCARHRWVPTCRIPVALRPPVSRRAVAPLASHRVSPRKNRARSRPGWKSAARQAS